MRIFLSWSGERSKLVAEVLKDWIPCVIQATSPWISTRDIESGAVWSSELNGTLQESGIGIICLTAENKDRPWILFEAGALSRGLPSNRACTFLIDIKPEDVVTPLSQFNHTLPDQEGMYKLMKTINMSLGDKALPEKILDSVFNNYWEEFENKFKGCIQDSDARTDRKNRSTNDLLTEILGVVRRLDSRRELTSISGIDGGEGIAESPRTLSYPSFILKMYKSGKMERGEAVYRLSRRGFSPSDVLKLLQEAPELRPASEKSSD